MKLRLFFPALAMVALSTFASSASAQIGLYLNPVFSRAHIGTADSGPYSFLGDGTTSRWFGGVAYGGYWDFYHQPKYSAGVDIRETTLHANNAALNTFSVAARIEGNDRHYGFRPYGQLAIGAGKSHGVHSTVSTTRLQWGIFGGLDYPIAKHVDFRAIELGYGTVTTMSSTIERANTNIPSASLIHISTGLVFRFK